MKNQANHKSLRDYRSALLLWGIIVGMIILMFIVQANDMSLQHMFNIVSMRVEYATTAAQNQNQFTSTYYSI